MGVWSSKMSEESSKNSSNTSVTSESNGFILGGHLLSPEVVTTVLSHVPAENLLLECRLVCRNWRDLIDEQSIWKLKCDRAAIPIPRISLIGNIPPHYYRYLAMKNPYGRNLIKNPCGDEGLRYWHYVNGGDGWVIEKPPNGADALNTIEELMGMERCFATSYYECKKNQIIDLIKEGCQAYILDECQPHILIKDWYAARFDCACRYVLTVTLMDGQRRVIKEFTTGPLDEDQWVGRAWHKVEHTFKDYGPGLRYINFSHSGQDLQFWAGNYGSKMTGSTVRILLA